MKFLFALSGLFLATSAFAGIESVGWEQIQQSRSQYVVDAPGTMYLNSNPRAFGSVYKRFIDFNGNAQACVAGDKIYGGTVQSCVKMDYKITDPDRRERASKEKRQEKVCVAYEPNLLWAPISGIKTVCEWYKGKDGERTRKGDTNDKCLEYKSWTYTINTNVTAKIYAFSSTPREDRQPSGKFDKETGRELLGMKQMQLPACVTSGK
jgi:hypothetical protein